MRPRDSQRQRLYDAERKLIDLFTVDKLPLDQIQDLVNRAQQSDVYKEYLPKDKKKIVVKKGRSGCSAYGNKLGITLPTWAQTKMIAMHELAHVMVIRKDPEATHEPHGWLFARMYLDLVFWCYGESVRDKLKHSFDLHRVAYTPYPLGPVTEEQRQIIEEKRKKQEN